ncbi:M20 aminoacylase family protein [Oceaniglobus ichthyenteri]|uniref:M20 aminoacylase family protein n=1 Tax=Oceaniglobus ichthyenteri TaxID=2136177 RepID=UPI000D3B2EDE|nr:M20 aminoacylase family protein [Oceaniglobus ichthyenteri]
MPVVNRIADFAEDMTAWRRWLHRNPELGFDLRKTAAFVAQKLRDFGVDELHQGIAQTGMVAIINGQSSGPTIGLRADMDALPIHEETGVDHASETPGAMHACGHDGHTTMLLGAARYLAETRRFNGRVALIFQPAEENGGGGQVMVDEGIMDRFDISQVFGIHNAPELPEGTIHTNAGAVMAAVDEFRVTVNGVGGHAAYPQDCVDPIPALVAMVQGFDTIVAHNNRPVDDLVVKVTQIHTGTANNVTPPDAWFSGTVRTFDPAVQEMVIARMNALVSGTAAAFGVRADLAYENGYPATINTAEATAFALDVARDVVGPDRVDGAMVRMMGAEDFSYMLNARPGCYLFLGQGGTAFCHHPAYDFNDAVAPIGASFFARLVERALPVR